jgi:hypothetical protein
VKLRVLTQEQALERHDRVLQLPAALGLAAVQRLQLYEFPTNTRLHNSRNTPAAA